MSASPLEDRRPGPPIGLAMLAVVAVSVIAMAGIQTISSIIAPAFFGLTMVVTARPLVTWLRKFLHLPGWLATLLTLIVIYVILLAIVGGVAYGVAETGQLLPQYYGTFQTMYTDLLNWVSGLGVDVTNFEQYLEGIDFNQIIGVVSQLANALTSGTSQAVLFVVITAFLGFDTINVAGRTESLRAAAPYLADALTGFASQVRKYWIVSTVFGAIVAIGDGIALMLMGVPLAWTWALFAFVTNYIPNIGFFIGLIPPALIGLLDGGLSTMIWIIVIYTVINNGFQTFIQPKVTGDAVGLNATVTFVSLVFWTAIVGPLGAILAVPLTLFAKAVLIDSDPRTRFFSVFLQAGDKKVTGTQADLDAAARLRAERRVRAPREEQAAAVAAPIGRKSSEITMGELRRARAGGAGGTPGPSAGSPPDAAAHPGHTPSPDAATRPGHTPSPDAATRPGHTPSPDTATRPGHTPSPSGSSTSDSPAGPDASTTPRPHASFAPSSPAGQAGLSSHGRARRTPEPDASASRGDAPSSGGEEPRSGGDSPESGTSGSPRRPTRPSGEPGTSPTYPPSDPVTG